MERLTLGESLTLVLALLVVVKGVEEFFGGNESLPWFALAAAFGSVFVAMFTYHHDPPQIGAWRRATRARRRRLALRRKD